MDQMIDSSFVVKSHHAGLVQVADLYAMILRRYAELHDYNSPEQWDGERSLIDEYAATLAKRLLPKAVRCPAKTTAACCKWYKEITPPSLLNLGN